MNIEKLLKRESDYTDAYPDDAPGDAEKGRAEAKARKEAQAAAAKAKEAEPEVVVEEGE